MTDRLPERPGEAIRRDRKVTLDFEGRRLEAYEGDTVGSALAAAGRLPVSLTRPERPADLVGPGVPLGEEPPPAPVAVQPPFDLPPVDVLAEEQVPRQVPIGCVRSGPASAFATVGELERLPWAAVRTADEEGHGRPAASFGTQTRQVTRSRTAPSALR